MDAPNRQMMGVTQRKHMAATKIGGILVPFALALLLAACADGSQKRGALALSEPIDFQGAAQQNAISQRDRTMRLEPEGSDLEALRRYQQMSDRDVSAEFRRYCPRGEPPCQHEPPQSLLQEATRRGLARVAGAAPPGTRCVTLGDLSGIGIAECGR